MAVDVETPSAFKGVTLKYAGKELEIKDEQVPYVIIIAASIILLVQSIFVAVMNQAYSISVAVVSLAVAIAAIALSVKMPIKWELFGKYVAYFLVLWNAVGAVILTFKGPFVATTNSYFAIWAMFMSSVVASKVNYGVVTDKVQNASSIGYIMIASFVLIIAILFVNDYNWRNLYSLTVAIVSTLLCSLLVFMESKGSESVKKIKLPILTIMAVLWLFVVIFLTFAFGTFDLTSNGFFGAWAGFIFSVYAACTC